MNDNDGPDLDTVEPLSESNPPGQNRAFKDAHREARAYVASLKLSSAIEREYLGACIDAIVYVFLFKIQPAQADVDPWVWVIVGDIPSACLRSDGYRTPHDALKGYIEAMQEWVAAARRGGSVAELIPVNVPPTAEYADMLGSRLKFLDERILPLLKD